MLVFFHTFQFSFILPIFPLGYQVVCPIDLDLFSLKFEESEPLSHVIRLELLSPLLFRGTLELKLFFIPIPRSFIKSLCNCFKLPDEIEDKTTNTNKPPQLTLPKVLRLTGMTSSCPVSLAEVCRLVVQPLRLKLPENRNYDIYNLEMWLGGGDSER